MLKIMNTKLEINQSRINSELKQTQEFQEKAGLRINERFLKAAQKSDKQNRFFEVTFENSIKRDIKASELHETMPFNHEFRQVQEHFNDMSERYNAHLDSKLELISEVTGTHLEDLSSDKKMLELLQKHQLKMLDTLNKDGLSDELKEEFKVVNEISKRLEFKELNKELEPAHAEQKINDIKNDIGDYLDADGTFSRSDFASMEHEQPKQYKQLLDKVNQMEALTEIKDNQKSFKGVEFEQSYTDKKQEKAKELKMEKEKGDRELEL